MERDGELPTFEYDQTIRGLPGGFRFPARMTVLPLAEGNLALVSPIPIDDELAARIDRLGRVQWLIAPNLLHHLYLRGAIARYPQARVLAPPGLVAKRPDITVHGSLTEPPSELTSCVDVVHIEGAPSADEFVFFHRATRSLVVTDLVFHVVSPQGFWAHVVLTLVGCHGRLAPTRVWRAMIKDKAATARSLTRVLGLPFDVLVMAHGAVVHEDARSKLTEAVRWMLPSHTALPASTA